MEGQEKHPGWWFWLILLVAIVPMTLCFLVVVWTYTGIAGSFTLSILWLCTVVFLAIYLHRHFFNGLREIAALLASLKDQGPLYRIDPSGYRGMMRNLIQHANQMREILSDQRKDAAETAALLEKVIEAISSAVFTFSPTYKCGLANKSGALLLGRDPSSLQGRHARTLGLENFLEGPVPRIETWTTGGSRRRFEVRRTSFRDGGKAHILLLLTDVTAPLRQEELYAWQRLVRVLRHEICNSLAPIQSLADGLAWRISAGEEPAHMADDLQEGLTLIAHRSATLGRMMKSYGGIADRPEPVFAPLSVQDWVTRNTRLLGDRTSIEQCGPPLTIMADGDQMDQLLTNLLKNADEAMDHQGPISVTWKTAGPFLHLEVWDEGPGLTGEPHLFVPFFTTKPDGSGIGLFISRSIAEAHGGTLDLENREEPQGCRAVLRIPVNQTSC